MKIKIYQINMGRDEHRITFLASDEFPRFTGSTEVNSSIYDCVFEGDVNCKTLEGVYQMFNFNHPEGYRGRSMSMSDILEIVDSESIDKGFYYCDTVGFTKKDFEPEKTQPLKPKEPTNIIANDETKTPKCKPGTSRDER